MIVGLMLVLAAAFVWLISPDLGCIRLGEYLPAGLLLLATWRAMDASARWQPRWRCRLCGKKNRPASPGDPPRFCMQCLRDNDDP